MQGGCFPSGTADEPFRGVRHRSKKKRTKVLESTSEARNRTLVRRLHMMLRHRMKTGLLRAQDYAVILFSTTRRREVS